jgi:uncharacterized protein DUF6345/Big-like domain-containing protein
MNLQRWGALAICTLVTNLAAAQTNLNFNDIKLTGEGAIQLNWNSTSNEVYEIDFANELADTNTGVVAWQPLYVHYPSHGTNTFVGDFGNYNLEANALHPKLSPMRFYRIALEGTNDGPSPLVIITSPTNGSVLSDEVTVSVVATSSLPVIELKLFVDGQEMDQSDDGTNFVINTCEWPNGPHTLFATARSQSSLSGPSGSFPVSIGRAVSPYANVTFDNLITRVGFSEPFFEPSLGQTQEVTAVFAANVDWTLQIIDETTNAVRTATGSGTSLKFDWNGTGDGGTNIPDGVYYYVISVATNGQPLAPLYETPATTSASTGDSGSIELFAIPADGSGSPAPLALYPPGADTNGLIIFESSADQVFGSAHPPASLAVSSSSAGFTPLGASGASSQSTTAPKRPPTAPVKNAVNNYAVGFYDFQTSVTRNNPRNGMPGPASQIVRLDGCSTCNVQTSDKIPEANMNSVKMIQTMKKLAWKLEFQKFNDTLPVNSVRRSDQGYNGGEIFTQATIGLFMDHGSYGTTLDYNPGASGSFQTYFPSGNPNDGTAESSWLRMCQFGFGGNLKWMAVLACNSICDPNWNSMQSHGAIPLKETHLVCGTASIAWLGEEIASFWAQNMIKAKQTVRQAWFDAASKQYRGVAPGVITNTVIFRVTGYPECIDDTIATNTAPSSPSPAPGNLIERHSQVYP